MAKTEEDGKLCGDGFRCVVLRHKSEHTKELCARKTFAVRTDRHQPDQKYPHTVWNSCEVEMSAWQRQPPPPLSMTTTTTMNRTKFWGETTMQCNGLTITCPQRSAITFCSNYDIPFCAQRTSSWSCAASNFRNPKTKQNVIWDWLKWRWIPCRTRKKIGFSSALVCSRCTVGRDGKERRRGEMKQLIKLIFICVTKKEHERNFYANDFCVHGTGHVARTLRTGESPQAKGSYKYYGFMLSN